MLELGFGRAELLLDLAAQNPGRVYLGVEVSRKRVLKAGKRAERRELRNVFMIHAPAEYVLERVLPAGVVEEAWVNCPDPVAQEAALATAAGAGAARRARSRARSCRARSCTSPPTTRAIATGSRR